LAFQPGKKGFNARAMIDARYDEIKSGRVKPIDGEEAFNQIRKKSEARRNS